MSESKSSTEPHVEYREIPGAPGYFAGSDGTIWSTWCNRWRQAEQYWHQIIGSKTVTGHLYILLSDGKRRQRLFAHQLVLFAFSGPCPDGMECRHLNGNPKDNRVENLAWGTHKENMQDAKVHGTFPYGKKHPGGKLSDDDVREVWRLGVTGTRGVDIARRFDVGVALVSSILSRKKRGVATAGLAGVPVTSQQGERGCSSILSEAQVRNIFARIRNGERPYLIAKEFGVAGSTIGGIMHGRKWKCLNLVEPME